MHSLGLKWPHASEQNKVCKYEVFPLSRVGEQL